jgi:hypothetical protein
MYSRKNKILTFADNNLFASYMEQTYLDQVNPYLVKYTWRMPLVTTSIMSLCIHLAIHDGTVAILASITIIHVFLYMAQRKLMLIITYQQNFKYRGVGKILLYLFCLFSIILLTLLCNSIQFSQLLFIIS